MKNALFLIGITDITFAPHHFTAMINCSCSHWSPSPWMTYLSPLKSSTRSFRSSRRQQRNRWPCTATVARISRRTMATWAWVAKS